MPNPSPIYPKPLQKGDKIGVISPSGWHDMAKFNPAIQFLNNYFEVVIHPQNHLKHGQFAGKTEERVEALHDYFKDSSIKGIFCTRGGNGAVHMLDKIDYNLIKNNPKIFIGFSNVSALLNAIHQQTGLVTFHGPMLVSLKNMIKDKWADFMLNVLMGKTNTLPINVNADINGILYGGCLSDLQSLIGTGYAPDLTNALLMIEDTNDHLSRYDRMLGHMNQARWLKKLNGILVGEFLNPQDSDNPFGFTIEDIVKNNAPNIPTVTNLPFGHGENLCTLPIGANCILKNGELSFKSL